MSISRYSHAAFLVPVCAQVLLNMNSKLMGTYGGTPVGSSVGRQNPVSLAARSSEISKFMWMCLLEEPPNYGFTPISKNGRHMLRLLP